VEPSRQAARRLMAEPQPRQFYGVMPSPRIAGLTDPLLVAKASMAACDFTWTEKLKCRRSSGAPSSEISSSQTRALKRAALP
jgi:hypothetical protein